MTTKMENAEIKQMIRDALDEKLDPIKKDIENIKVNLTNHVAHLTDKLNTIDKSYGCLNNDVGWLKKFFDPETNIKRDTESKSDIAWLKWGVRGVLMGIVAEAIAIVAHVFIK